MQAMTVKEFDSLEQRDFENGAVRDSMRAALKEREQGPPQVAVELVDKAWVKYSNPRLEGNRGMTKIGFMQAIQELGLKIVG